MDRETESFINDYVEKLRQGTATVFVGAGLSRGAGYVDWKGLLSDIAYELELDIEKETDLVSLAQFYKNRRNSREKLNHLIINKFADKIDPTENHEIIARLPYNTIWTTNYDALIEKAHENQLKTIDVKSETDHLFVNIDNRNCTIYKMHGDKSKPNKAVLLKEDYERYYYTHESFLSILKSELITKSMLFIGFSFTDPNINYIFGRLTHRYSENSKNHYCIIKKVSIDNFDNDIERFEYEEKKQQLMIEELIRYRVETILVDNYTDITDILQKIEKRYNSHSIFISGSAAEYGDFSEKEAQDFIHLLSKKLIENKLTVVNGFGLGVGSSVINGALDAIYSNSKKYSEKQLIVKPFPQFSSGETKLEDLWENYRKNMISRAGIFLILFGNKKSNNDLVVLADGVQKEFEIAIEKGLVPIPIFDTSYMAKEIYNQIKDKLEKYNLTKEIFDEISDLKIGKENIEEIVDRIINIVNKIVKQ